MSIESLTADLRAFAIERDWEQFHTPKNLASALNVEAGELLERFQWLTPEDSDSLDASTRESVGEELADVFFYLLYLTDRLNLDLLKQTARKIELNAERYGLENARGHARKAPHTAQ